MRLRKIGDYDYKGDVGWYFEAVDVPVNQPRYTAIDSMFLPDELFPAILAGEIFNYRKIADLFYRIDECL